MQLSMFHGMCVLVSLILIQLVTTATEPASSESSAAIEKDIQGILSARNAIETQFDLGAAKGYEILFKRVGPEGIRQLKSHPNDQIAVRAAWEEIRLTVPEKEQRWQWRLNKERLQYFLGVLEGRLRVPAPDSWKKELLGLRAWKRDNIFPNSDQANRYRYDPQSECWLPRNVEVKQVGGKSVLSAGEQSLVLPESLTAAACRTPGPSFSVLFQPQVVYVALHGDRCGSYFLFAIDRKSSTTAWRARVWAAGDLVMYMGPPGSHAVSILIQDSHVLVFGAGDGSLYVEAFDAADGKNCFRFSTSY